MKILALLITVLCFLALSLTGISAAADTQSPASQVIYSYQGNITDKDIIPVALVSFMGPPAYFVAEAVKFKAPKPGWKLNAVQLLGWDGFNGTTESIPRERIIALEVRDKDLNLLYKFADSQLPYSNFVRNATIIYPFTINIPQIPVSNEFYVCFYDRGAIKVASEPLNETSENSFFYVEEGNQLLPAVLPTRENASTPVNWIMAISGN